MIEILDHNSTIAHTKAMRITNATATTATKTADTTTAPQPPRVLRGSAGVFDHIRLAIVSGDYHFNQRLPSERDLAAQFRIARGTIRTALRQLEHANLVERKFGSGTFITYNQRFDQDDIAEQTSPLELIETRLAIEPHIVKLIVTNATHRDLTKLDQAFDHIIAAKSDPNAFSAADEAFHLTMAHCSQNQLLIWMYQRINDIRSHSQWSERKTNILSAQKIDTYNRQHAELLRLIKRRDMRNAAQAMIAHLNQAKKDLLGRH